MLVQNVLNQIFCECSDPGGRLTANPLNSGEASV